LGSGAAIKTLIWILAILAGLYVLILAGVSWKQRSLLYFPRRDAVSPAEAGLAKAQALRLTTADGESLNAWYVPAQNGKPLFLYFHGNGGGLSDRAQRFALMTATGYGLLAVSYRSYFGSTGSPSEAGLHLDADAAYAEALRLGYAPGRIIAVGESLGTGVATALATREPLAALILDSPYASIVDIAAEAYWMIPVRFLMLDQYHSDRIIGEVHVAVLMMHGTKDKIIPMRSAQALFALANEPNDFIEVPGGGHLVLGRPDVWPKVLAWADAHVGSKE
jgi:fermentation-respiration switch protein FrsA (DUF1100 family)